MKSLIEILIKHFLTFLEKFSAFLERASKKRERRYAYFLCVAHILLSLFGMIASIGFFIYHFRKQSSFDVRITLILFLVVILFILGTHIHMMVTRDLRYIRSRDPNKKEDIAKKRKIEF